MTPKYSASLLAAIALTASILAWRCFQAENEARFAAVVVLEKQHRAATAIHELEANIARGARERDEHLAALAAIRNRPRGQPVATVKVTPSPVISIAERLRKEPETQLYYLAAKRAESAAKFGPLFRQLGLDSGRIAKFQENAVRREEQQMDNLATLQTQGLSQDNKLIAKLNDQLQHDYDVAQRELLGEEGFRALKDYERTEWTREYVNGWAGGAVLVARDPLTLQQGEQLVQIVANASRSYREGGAVNPNEIDWAAVDAEARQILSAAQFKMFTTTEPPLPVGARFQSRLHNFVDRAQKADAATGAASPGATN
jgi:hypothetical protein